MSAQPRRPHYAWIVLAMGTLVVFGSLGLARFGYTAVLPTMQESLGLDNTQAGVLATANLVGYLILSAVGGALASRYGSRLVSTLGLALAGVGMLCTGMVHGFVPALIWRAITGIGSGAGNVSIMGMWSAWFSRRRRGRAAGVAVSGSSLGLILIGPLVPQLLARYGADGWRVCWFIFGGLALVVAAVGYALLRNRPEDKGLLPFGVDTAGGDPTRAGALEWSRVYRARPVWHLGLVYVAFGFSYIIYMTFFTKRLVAEGGYTSASAGSLFMTMGWFSLICGLLWGAVSDAIGRKRALVIVYAMHAVSFALFALWPTPAGFTISAVLFGLSAWSIPAIMAAACGDVLGPRLAPAALGFITLFFGLGQAVGPTLAGWMADAAGSFFAAYLLAALVALAGALGALSLRTPQPGQG